MFLHRLELEKIARDHQPEAGELENLLDELNALPDEATAWEPRFARLINLVSRHT